MYGNPDGLSRKDWPEPVFEGHFSSAYPVFPPSHPSLLIPILRYTEELLINKRCLSNRICLVCILFVLLQPLQVQAAEKSKSVKNRPRIGLVLGGGGARGAAHIGVLKALEELRIPIDAVAGTSVGAIIGGMYAAGTPVADIEREILAIDWVEMFADDTVRPDLSFRRKEDDFDFLIEFGFGVNSNGVMLPRGFVQGQKTMLFFRRVLWPVYNVRDFDDLPIPFRAVATDLLTGKPVIIGEGDLAMAMRASMAVPGVYAPVELDGHLLVDGGLTSNLPVQVMRDMNVDIIIAVDVGYPLNRADNLRSVIDITDQMFNIFINNESAKQQKLLGPKDVFIDLHIGEMYASDFPQVAQAVEPGRQSILRQAQRLRPLGMDQTAYQRYTEQRTRRPPPPRIERVRIYNNSVISSEDIRSVIKTRPGKVLDPQQLARDVSRIYGTGLFERVDTQLRETDDGTELDIHTYRKSWGPNYLNFGIDLENDFEGGSDFNLSARYTATELNARAAEWRTDAQIGVNPRLFSEFYQPLSRGSPFFMAPQIELEADKLDIFEAGKRIAEFRVSDQTLGMAIGREFSNWGELRFGVRRGDGSARLRVGDPQDPALAESDFEIGQYLLRLSYDKLDNVRFPQHGARWQLQGLFSREALSADDAFDLYSFNYLHAGTAGRHTLVGRIEYGSKRRDDDSGLQDVFRLGGFLNLSGLQRGELVGNHYGLAGLIYYYHLGVAKDSLFSVPMYIGGSIEAGNVWQTSADVSASDTLAAGSLIAGMDTFLGPVYLALGRTETGERALYFFLGQSF
jgi:NTE family protein